MLVGGAYVSSTSTAPERELGRECRYRYRDLNELIVIRIEAPAATRDPPASGARAGASSAATAAGALTPPGHTARSG